MDTMARFQPWIRLGLTVALAIIAIACGGGDSSGGGGGSTAPGY